MKRTTIKDLAKYLSINISTVSRALKDHPDISTNTKERVKEAARLMNYSPNDMAVNFRNNKSKLIGVIVPELSMFFIPSLLSGVAYSFKKAGYQLMILLSENQLEKEKENIEVCLTMNVEGILLSAIHDTLSIANIELMQHINIPFVLFDKTVNHNNYKQVIIDDKILAKQAAEKFNIQPINSIVAIWGNPNLSITKRRKEAFISSLHADFLSSYKELFAHSMEETKNQVIDLLKKHSNEHMYIFCMSDEILGGVNAAIETLEISFKSLKVMAISNGDLPKILHPSIEIIKHDGYQLGSMAAKVLINEINGLNFDFEDNLVLL